MLFRVLHPVTHRDEWLTILLKIGGAASDPHFSPWYLEAERLLGGQPLLAVYQYEHYFVAKPIVLRRVEIGSRAFGNDITSPHGFGGPVSNHGPRLHEWFDQEFQEWCRTAGVICEYCSLNPMHIQHQRSLVKSTKGIEPRERKQIVWMDLDNKAWGNPESVQKGVGYKEARIAGIKAAQKHRVTIRQSENAREDDAFVDLYEASMGRKNAAARWRFEREYLWALCEGGQVFTADVHVEDGIDTASAALIMAGGDVAYYHMAASKPDYPKVGANDLLVHEIALWARASGIKRFHLGGGVTADEHDHVFFFKQGFSPLRAPAMSCFRVFDEAKYRAACAAKIEEEIDKTGAEFRTHFEPLYRREI